MIKTSFNLDSVLWEKAKKIFERIKDEISFDNMPTNPTQWIDRHLRLLVQGKDPIMGKYVKYTAVGVAAAGIMGFSVWGYNQYEIRKTKCSDFKTQAESQVFFEKHNATWLDRDSDFKSCEALPKR